MPNFIFQTRSGTNPYSNLIPSFGVYRVLGSLQNFPEFAKAFSCKENSYMVPDTVCRVW